MQRQCASQLLTALVAGGSSSSKNQCKAMHRPSYRFGSCSKRKSPALQQAELDVQRVSNYLCYNPTSTAYKAGFWRFAHRDHSSTCCTAAYLAKLGLSPFSKSVICPETLARPDVLYLQQVPVCHHSSLMHTCLFDANGAVPMFQGA
jgi:hypothetical protein